MAGVHAEVNATRSIETNRKEELNRDMVIICREDECLDVGCFVVAFVIQNNFEIEEKDTKSRDHCSEFESLLLGMKVPDSLELRIDVESADVDAQKTILLLKKCRYKPGIRLLL
jgi:hypothetical protein